MTTTLALVNVTVPARLLVVASKLNTERTVDSENSVERVSFASKVRDFVVDNPECEWISESPFVNGKAWWVAFQFSCFSGYVETCIKGLHGIGVGDEEDGRGAIHVLPVNHRHIASRPRHCGRPASLPYSPPSTPQTTPGTPALKKKLYMPVFEVEMGGEDDPGSPRTDATQDDTEMQGSPVRSEVTFGDYEYEDGAELEDESERLRAKLIAEIEASEEKKDTLQKYTENFAETVKSRVAVDALIQYVTSASEFSFDYVMLCAIAAIIACIGLVTNNQVVIVASMLVSPLMGPILAQTLGTVLGDHGLVKKGFFVETVGLGICIVVGFIGGLCAAPADGDTWPTDEMLIRAVTSSLYIGVAVALPSGMGAALSVTGNNTSSLVGVAISASLLPPAVNAGILFAAASLHGTGLVGDPDVDEDSYPNDSPAMGAVISFSVAIVNIICIYIGAVFMFHIKEVRGVNTFWKEDVRNARKYNQAVRQDSGVASVYKTAFVSAARRKISSSSARRNPGDVFLTPLEKLKTNWRKESAILPMAKND